MDLLNKYQQLSICILFIFLCFVVSCGPSAKTKKIHESALSMVGLIPGEMPGAQSDTKKQIELGELLFHDPILSANQKVSCNTCHDLKNNGVGIDGTKVSIGIDGLKGQRNAPTVWNAGFHVAQFWDGRAASLEEQAGGPILNPVEMGKQSKADVISRLNSNPKYTSLFKLAFPALSKPVTYANIEKTLAAFERTLITKDLFDQFQAGDLTALNGRQLKGFTLFTELGCISCHNGPLLGGNTFRRLGGVIPYENVEDTGRFAFTGIEAEKFVFKVPSLRNVEHTAPYFHDGSRPTLNSAIRSMARLQLGKDLNTLQVNYITEFLKTLSDPRFQKGTK